MKKELTIAYRIVFGVLAWGTLYNFFTIPKIDQNMAKIEHTISLLHLLLLVWVISKISVEAITAASELLDRTRGMIEKYLTTEKEEENN